MAHQEVLLRLQGRRIQGLLQVIPDQQAAQLIGALTNLALQCFEFVRAGHKPRCPSHLSQLVKDLLYVPGVIGILARQTRVTRHVDAPLL